MRESQLWPQFLAVERLAERGLFVHAALSLSRELQDTLGIIIHEAYRSGGVAAVGDEVEVEILAARIEAATDTALAQWMERWKPTPPEWFGRKAIAVMIQYMQPTTAVVTQAPIGPFYPPDVDLATHDRRDARKILNAVWKAHLDAYLETAYGDLERRARVFRHYEWTARFQFVPESHATIAKAANVAEHTVREAVSKVAQVIGLSLRTDSPEMKIKPGPKPNRDT